MGAGFADPVRDAQRVFRAVMDALSRPGRIAAIDCALSPPPPIGATVGGVALALCDPDTPVWIDRTCGEAVAGWLRFMTGAPLTETPEDAAFALIAEGGPALRLDLFAQGAQDHPDRSTTLIVQVPSLAGGPPLRLSGPGIDGIGTMAPSGLPGDFVAQWTANHARFPRGVDILLCAGEGILGLPRSTTIAAAEA